MTWAASPSVSPRDVVFIKVATMPKTRSRRSLELVNVFFARVVDLAPGSLMTIEITGSESKIEGLLQVLNENEDRVLEISRTGRMVMRRGHHTSRVLELRPGRCRMAVKWRDRRANGGGAAGGRGNPSR